MKPSEEQRVIADAVLAALQATGPLDRSDGERLPASASKLIIVNKDNPIRIQVVSAPYIELTPTHRRLND
ncbi:hypothetical protein [Alteromonas sp. OM2203]|uniref:hypothetical protein n=1 Tax=Alteromonas sp. OM2203 TaxID=3398817 RepID=UPI003AF33948